MTRFAVITALYVVLTYALEGLAYGPLQFRVSEVMTLLAFVNPFYVLPLTLGCVIVNFGSPFGLIDVVFGSLSSFLALLAMSKTKNLYLASLWPSIFSIVVGLEIFLLSSEPINFFLMTGQIMLSQFIIVSILGLVLYKLLKKNSFLASEIKNIPE